MHQYQVIWRRNALFGFQFEGFFIWLFQLKFLSFDELQKRMSTLDSEMEREIEELRKRYETKRQPILEAIDRKRKRQPQPFWHLGETNDLVFYFCIKFIACRLLLTDFSWSKTSFRVVSRVQNWKNWITVVSKRTY